MKVLDLTQWQVQLGKTKHDQKKLFQTLLLTHRLENAIWKADSLGRWVHKPWRTSPVMTWLSTNEFRRVFGHVEFDSHNLTNTIWKSCELKRIICHIVLNYEWVNRILETGIKSVFNFCKFLRTSSRVETYYWTTIATPVLAFYWKTCVNNALVKSSVLGFTNYRATEQVSACNLVSPYGDLRAKIQIIWELILLSHIGSQPLTDTHTHTHQPMKFIRTIEGNFCTGTQW